MITRRIGDISTNKALFRVFNVTLSRERARGNKNDNKFKKNHKKITK